MSFQRAEIEAMAESAPAASFLGASQSKIADWIEFVTSADETPKDQHPLTFYAFAARVLAQAMGSLSPVDYADSHMRSLVLEMIKPGATPFESDADAGPWQDELVLPAHLTLCLRVQARAQKAQDSSGGSSNAAPGGDQALAQAIASLTAATTTKEKESKKGVLSFDLKARLAEVGLADFARELLPSEESLIRVESMGKSSKDKGRHFVGASDGEDLMLNFRPTWSRTPKIDVFVGEGSLEDKMKAVLEVKRARSAEDRVGFTSFPNFLGHVMDWGTKMIILKVFSTKELMAYVMNLTRISEELGGVRVAYQYDLVLRQRMAQALERGETTEVHDFLLRVHKDDLGDAKNKLDQRTKETTRAASGKAGGKANKGTAQVNAVKQTWGAGSRAPSTPTGRSRSPRSGKAKDKGGKGGKDKGGKSGKKW